MSDLGFETFRVVPEDFLLHPSVESFCSFRRGNFYLGQDSSDCYALPEPIYKEFAPIGAKWYVELFEPFAPDFEGTVRYESFRDTVVNGKACRVIYKSHWSTSVPLQGEFIIHQEYGRVYHYIEEIDSFNLLFDFLAKPGDSWRSFDRGNSYVEYGTRAEYLTEVDSFSFDFDQNTINPVRIQHVSVYNLSSGQKQFIRNDEIIECVGFRNAFLPDSEGDGFTDDVVEGNVRCYEDENVGYNFTDGDCFTSAIEEPLKDLGYHIYPNPTSHILNIDYPGGRYSGSLQITDVTGKILLQSPLTPSLDLGNMTTGCYFLTIWTDNRTPETMKFFRY